MPPRLGRHVCKEGQTVHTIAAVIAVAHEDLDHDRAYGGNGTAVQSEDCLLINIMAPHNASNLPVYIYV